ncbi:MAG: Protein TusB [Alphaproteobacteria bacterium MarineAlpha3_Bin5]|nr:sulfurtransferase complex subunit TusB [Magnetovibrio sp.]PPR79417.1 MAG: Protein TusB [Alphaproteobacteria bacterium MarineAlpha3_Bin5]
MRILNVVNKSPFERNCLESCLRLANSGSSILLIEDGVYAALGNTAKSTLIKNDQKNLGFYVLINDLDARGLSEAPMIDSISRVDYDGFVDLVVDHDSIHSWL